jgi:hypothetical protein
MEYLLMVYSKESAWADMTPEEQQQGMAAYGAFTEALKQAGAYKGASRLQPTSTATTVRATNGKSQVLNGPYAESKEQLGGYFLIEAPNLDGAIAWASRCPGAHHGVVELRPLWPM